MKKMILVLFVLLSVFVFGCYTPTCGNGLCEESEKETCPRDCDFQYECVFDSDCDDNDPATSDVCSDHRCEHILQGCTLDSECDDEDDYTHDICSEGTCYHTQLECIFDSDCEDGDLKTTDTCIDNTCSHSLPECVYDYDCDDNNPGTVDTCVDNICEHEMQQCTDTDGGYNTSIKGTVTYNGTSYEDYCLDITHVNEYYCDGSDEIGSSSFVCYYGACSEGRCVNPYSECVDIDSTGSLHMMTLDGRYMQVDNIDTSGLMYFKQQGDSYSLIDPVNQKVLAKIDDSKQQENFILSQPIEKRTENKIGYIVELEEPPLSKILGDYGQKYGSSLEKYPKAATAMSYEMKSQQATIEKSVASVIGILQKEEIISDKDVKERYSKAFSGFSVSADAEVAEIEKIPGVKKVYLDREVHTLLDISVPLINADDVWAHYTDQNGNPIDGTGIEIGIIDTGVDYTHPDLGGCLGEGCKVMGGYDFVNYDNDPIDDHGHGTHCAATAAGTGVLEGVAPGANIYAYKVLNSAGMGYDSSIIAAIERAMDPNQDGDLTDHLDVISLSLGYAGGTPDDPSAVAIDNAVYAGVVAAVAAGNNGQSGYTTVGCPGCARKAITVGASDDFDDITYFSSRGPTQGFTLKPDLVAPGLDICAAQHSNWMDSSSCIDDEHISISGTSMATPHVAGAAALLLQYDPDLTPEETKALLMQNTLDYPSYDMLQTGTGRLDILASMKSDTIVTPSMLEINYSDGDTHPVQIKIKNTATVPRAYSLSIEKGTRFSNNVLTPVDYSIGKYYLCVKPGSEQVLSVDVNVRNPGYGLYSGTLLLNEFESCNPGLSKLDSKKIPFFFKKLRKVDVTVIGKDYGFNGTYSKNTQTIFYGQAFAEKYLTNTDDFSFTVYLSDDGIVPVSYISWTWEYIGYVSTSYKTVFYGIYLLPGQDSITIDENDAVEVLTNFESVSGSHGLQPHQAVFGYSTYPIYVPSDYPENRSYTVTPMYMDTKCNYLVNGIQFFVYNGGLYERIFVSGSAKRPNTWPIMSDTILTASHEFYPGEPLIYEYDPVDFHKVNITWDDTFAFSPYTIQSGHVNFWNRSWAIGFGTTNEDNLSEQDMPHNIELIYSEPINLWTGSYLLSYPYTSLRAFHMYGNPWYAEVLPYINDSDIEFYNSPINDMKLYVPPDRPWMIESYFEPTDDYEDMRNRGIWMERLGLTSLTSTLPDSTVMEGSGNVFISCFGNFDNNPPIGNNNCQQGIYNFKWDASDLVKSGVGYMDKSACWTGGQWLLNFTSCP